MAENIDHKIYDLPMLFKFLLNLMEIEEARAFETHFWNCEECKENLTKVTGFLELLQKALCPPDLKKSREASQSVLGGQPPADETTALAAVLQERLSNPANIDELISVMIGFYKGFQKLRKNIGAHTEIALKSHEIDQIAIEILLALPGFVTKS